MRVLIACILLCGCDRIFGFDAITVIDAPGGSADASHVPMVDGAASPDVLLTPICPANYGMYSGRRYRIELSTKRSWAAAEVLCTMDQVPNSSKYTHLVVLDDDTERSAITTATGNTTTNAVWVGLRRTTEWRWVTDQPNMGYPLNPSDLGAWTGGGPNGGAGADCVENLGPSGLSNLACSNTLGYICECDDWPENPSSL